MISCNEGKYQIKGDLDQVLAELGTLNYRVVIEALNKCGEENKVALFEVIKDQTAKMLAMAYMQANKE